MMNLDNSILKEFDKQRFNVTSISWIMDKLDTNSKKKSISFILN